MTPLSQGDPDLFCTIDGSTPDSSAPYKAQGFGQDTITIPPNSNINVLYCMVKGFTETSYSIVYSENARFVLANGNPLSDIVMKNGMRYFTFTAVSSEVTIIATPINGSISVFVGSGQYPVPEDPNSYIPRWSSTFQYTGTPLVIQQYDPDYPSGGKFYITVLGVEVCIFILQFFRILF